MNLFRYRGLNYKVYNGPYGGMYIIKETGQKKYLNSHEKTGFLQDSWKIVEIDNCDKKERMIENLGQLLLKNNGEFKFSEYYSIPLSGHNIKRWISVSKREVENCLIFGKGKKFYFYVGTETRFLKKNVKVGSDEFMEWRRTVKDDEKKWWDRVIKFFQSYNLKTEFTPHCRITVWDLTREDKLDIISLIYPHYNRWEYRHVRRSFEIWRQISRCRTLSMELMKRACHPSRINNI